MDINENKINDLDIYLARMQKSMLDKMFFVDKVFEPFEYILDFGCANGELLKTLQQMLPCYKYIGYDISEDMAYEAKRNVPNAKFFTDWNRINIPFERSLLNISSTIHEVYSYGTEDSINEFWNRVFNSGFKYITIRDMMTNALPDEPPESNMIRAIRSHKTYGQRLHSFEKINGPIKSQKQLVHFLLKYRYEQNWDREVRENYLPISESDITIKAILSGYRITYRESLTLPYIAWQIKKDFGITLANTTHMKLILERCD